MHPRIKLLQAQTCKIVRIRSLSSAGLTDSSQYCRYKAENEAHKSEQQTLLHLTPVNKPENHKILSREDCQGIIHRVLGRNPEITSHQILEEVVALNTKLTSLSVVPFVFQDVSLMCLEPTPVINDESPDSIRSKEKEILADINCERLIIKTTDELFDRLCGPRNYAQSHTYTSSLCNQGIMEVVVGSKKLGLDGKYLDKLFDVDSQTPEQIDNLLKKENTSFISETVVKDETYSLQGYDNDQGKKDMTFTNSLTYFVSCLLQKELTNVNSRKSSCDKTTRREVVPHVPPPSRSFSMGSNQWLKSAVCYSVGYDLGDNHVHRCSDKDMQINKDKDSPARPSLDQLMHIQDTLAENIPKILKAQHDYRIYRPEIIFENNCAKKPYTTKGITAYVLEVAKLRFWVHFTYANVKLQLIRMDKDEEEGVVKVQWRITGIPQARAFMFWKFLPGIYKSSMNKESESHEGISTFYVDGTGLIYKHKMDNVIEQQQTVVNKEGMVEKLRRLTTARPEPVTGAACK